MPAKRETSRRDFLTGRSAVEAVGDWTHGETGETDPPAARTARSKQPSPVPTPTLLQIGRQAMACQFEVILSGDAPGPVVDAADAALDLVDQLENQLSVYREHSEICDINRRAGQAPVAVEPRLFALLELAGHLHQVTDGAFDITSTPLSQVWGFFRRQGGIPPQDELAAALERVAGAAVKLDRAAGTIAFDRPGLEINLNSIGKGYALDRCRELLLDFDVGDFLLHGGSSSLLACGSRADMRAEAPGWPVALRHPLRPGQRLAEIRICDRALGTSGAAVQNFTHRGRRYGHILDPRTGQPAEGVYSATVLAPTAAEADALATASYVLGVERAFSLCEEHPDWSAILVTPGKTAGSIEVHSSGLDETEWRLV